MDKNQLIGAINEMLDGVDTGGYHDALSVILALVDKATEAQVAEAWVAVSTE